MNGKEVISLRKYDGHGTISFANGDQLECDFELNYYDSGRNTLKCHLPLSPQFLRILDSEADKDEKNVLEASFKGLTSDRGNIVIEKMGLDRTTASPDLVRSNIFYDGRTLKITDQILSIRGKGLFIFIVISKIEIIYSILNDESVVISKWSLTNFQFAGSERSIRVLPNWDKFTIHSGGLKLHFIQSVGYHQIIDELSRTGRNSITTDVESLIKFKDNIAAFNKLIQLCWIMSLLTSNWVMPLYNDIFLRSKIVRSILYPSNLTYPFIDNKHVVDIYDSNFLIEDFAKTALENYDIMKDDFALNAFIEYYISAIRQKTPEAQFLMGMIACECLSSYVPKFASKNHDQIISKDMESKRKAIIKVKKRLNLNLSEKQIDVLAEEVAHNFVGLKDSLRYIFSIFHVPYRNEDLNALVSIRGALVHSGKYHDFAALLDKTDVLFNLLITLLLKMLGWKDNVRYVLY
jgi:hypothetical protein